MNEKDRELMEKQTGLLAWIKSHKKELAIVGISISTITFAVLSIKNKDALVSLWNNLKEEISKPDIYSSKWFKTVSNDALNEEREIIRVKYCSSSDDFSEACRLERLLLRFDEELSIRKWGDKTPEAPKIYREHGWYLPNDD